MTNLSKSNQFLIKAYEKGYRVIDGEVFKNNKKKAKIGTNKQGYNTFGKNIKIHRLVAYQKYGNKMFEPKILVRHRDGNKQNNSYNNILLGSDHDNHMDKDPKDRLIHSLKAASKHRKFTDVEIELIRQDFKINKLTYKQIMAKWSISSKGTLSYIINNKYQTHK